MSAWNGSDDYMFSERVFSRENSSNHNIPYQQQLFIREGGLKHFTNDSLNSNQFLASAYVDYPLLKKLTDQNLFAFMKRSFSAPF